MMLKKIIVVYSTILFWFLCVAVGFKYLILFPTMMFEDSLRQTLTNIVIKNWYIFIPSNIFVFSLMGISGYISNKLVFLKQEIWTKKLFIVTCASVILSFLVIYLPLWILLMIKQTKDKTYKSTKLKTDDDNQNTSQINSIITLDFTTTT